MNLNNKQGDNLNNKQGDKVFIELPSKQNETTLITTEKPLANYSIQKFSRYAY